MSYTNILEGARQYFQGLPSANTNNNSSNPAGQRNAGNEAGNVAPQSPAGAPPPQPAVTQQPQQPPPVLQQPQQPQAAPQWPSHSAPGQPPPAPDLRWAKPLDATQAQYVYPQYNVPQQQQQQPQTKYPAEMYNNVAQKNNYNNFTQQQSGKSHNNVAYQYQEKSKQPVVANSYMYNHTAPVSRGQQQAYDVKSSIPTPVSRVSGQQQAYDVKSSIASPVSRGQQQVYDVKSSIPRAPSNHDGRHYERNSMVNSSSGQSNYPTMGSIDRAFAQYSSPKMLPTTSSPAPTANSFLANRPSTSYPAHYPANMSRPVHSKPASHYQEQMTQPSPKQQQQTQQFNQKLHQYYQYNSQLMPTSQQQQQYPTMTNPTASWVQSAMGQQQQQYRQVSQQQQQQQQALPQHQIQQQFAQPAARQQTPHHPMVSEANSSQHLVSMAHHMSKERPLQHDQHAQMLQRPKLPPPRPQQTPRAPGVRRDSPLDLSVRTIRRSADSTLDDERGTPEHPLAPPPDTSRMQQPDLSLQSLLRSSENALLPPFQRFRQGSLGGSMGETKSPCASSTLHSMEHKFGPRVTAAAETLTSLAHQQYTPRQQYIPPRSIREGHATPHLAAHALAQQQQQHAASQFRPNSGSHSAADKRVLSILRNSLEERSNQQKLMLAAQQQQQQQQQQQNAAAAGNMAAQHRSQGPRPALDHSHLLRQHMQASPQAALPLPAMVQELPPSSGPQHSSSELDGLAAFLAARIRTKAELKQCGDAHQSLQATPGGGAAAPGAAHRTRGDCPCGEDNCGCPVQSMTLAVTSRKVSETRSSTETSVFDFPDSDPEMAAPASVSDLRRHRKPPSTDIPLDCPPGASTPGPSAAAAPPPPPPVEEDPAWASLCTNFVTSLETKGAKTSRAGIQALNTARKRKAEASEEPSKVPKLEVKVELPKPEPKVLKEEMELIESCLKVSSDCEKLLETIPPIPKLENNSDSDVVNKKSSRKIVVESSSSSESESDSEESLSLAARQQQRLQEFLSSSESSNSSSEDSDWSDDIGKAAAVRLRERNTRNKSRAYSIRTRLRSQRNSPPAKRPGRPRRKIVKSPSSDSEEEKSESPKPRRTRQRHSPSPMSTRKTRRKSKSPVSTITTRLRNKSKSPARKKSKSPPLTRQTRRKSKSPEPKKQSPISTTVKKSKSPPPVATRQSRRQSKSPVTSSKDPGFYPGWDSDLVKFKQSWRMPSNLIMVHSRPNSDPPTPTKKRRGCTNSPISCASDPGISGNLRSLASRKILRDFDTSDSSNSTPVKIRKPMIRDVELSDSSNSLPFRPRRTESSSAKPLKDRQELFAKLTDKIKGRGRKKQLECEEEEEEAKITRAESDDDKKPKLRRGLRQRRRSSRLSGSLDKRLLRSAALHRSNRALINSKRHLRRRDLKASEPVIVRAKRGPKGRRKLRSSGFDYLRKKKKKKEERETKRVIGIPGLRQVSGSVEEVANEVRAWVVNKGLGETVLHQAARKNHDDAVAYLLELQGMDPSVKDNAGFTPLHIASARGFLTTARLLLLYSARVDSSAQGGIRPLHEAAECGHVEVCRLLLSYGADPGLAKYSGATPLMLASTPEVWQLLKDHIADMQGTPASPWDLRHQWNIDSVDTTGFNVIEDPPTSPPALSDHDFDFEDVSSEHAMTAPASWWLPGESEPLMLLLEVCSTLGHGLDWLRRALRSDVTTKDIPRSQFNETARPVQLLATNWKPNRQLCVSEPNQNDTLLTLIRADDKLRSLLEAASYARSRASR